MRLSTVLCSTAVLFFLALPCAVRAQNSPDSGPAKAAPAAPAAKKAAGKTAPAAKSQGAPVVGTMSSAPERKLGVAREPCVYKPVMTDAEIARCR